MSLPAGGYFLVQMSAVGATGAALPGPDFTDPRRSRWRRCRQGRPARRAPPPLAATAARRRARPTQLARIKDLVGYGTGTTGATSSRAAGPLRPSSATTAAVRAGNGATDTDDNAADFTAAAPNPRTAGDPAPTVTAVSPADGATGVAVDAHHVGDVQRGRSPSTPGTIQLACNDATVDGDRRRRPDDLHLDPT